MKTVLDQNLDLRRRVGVIKSHALLENTFVFV